MIPAVIVLKFEISKCMTTFVKKNLAVPYRLIADKPQTTECLKSLDLFYIVSIL